MIRLIKNILGKTIKFIYRITYKLIPTHKKTILFIAFHGRGYSDNPRAIYEYLHGQSRHQRQAECQPSPAYHAHTCDGTHIVH